MSTGSCQSVSEPGTQSGWWRAAVAMVVGVTLARLAYLAWWCPYELIEDEAHYWEWSRRLGWSYYSKGPGIALAIRGATELLGTSEWAVRAPAVIAGMIAALAVGALGAEVSGSRRVGWYAAAAFLLAPMLQAVGLLATIDGPYVACWAVACWAMWRALRRGGRWAWLIAGAAVGIGFLFKYTIVLLLPGLIGYAVMARRRPALATEERGLTLAPEWGLWMALGIVAMAAGLAPVAVWNAQNDWPTVHHLLGHLGVRGGDMPVAGDGGGPKWSITWPLKFLGAQLSVGPALILAGIGVRRAWMTRGGAAEPGRSFLVWCAAPIVLFYVVISCVAEAKGNWAMGGYATLLALAGWEAADGVAQWRASRRTGGWRRMAWHYTVGCGLVVAVGIARADWAAGGVDHLGKLLHVPWRIPLGRIFGGREMAAHTGELAADLGKETGREPFVLVQHYGRASLLAFYLREDGGGAPNAAPHGPLRVYCSSSRMGGRRTQYDYWADTDVDDPGLRGRPAVLVGGSEEQWRSAFAEVRRIGTLRGDTKRGRDAFVGLGFVGLPPPPRDWGGQ